MTFNLSIIGLGQVGTSIGLALAGHSDQVSRVGYDILPDVARKAQKLGAVDKISRDAAAAAREANVVLLAVPFDQIQETLKIIAPELKEGAVVMDTSPVKSVVAAWAKELLPPGCQYVGLTPVLNPLYLHETGVGIEVAREDLFKRSLMVIATPPGSGEAVKTAADLVQMVGAEPLFADLVEVDGLMAATHFLPQLAATALLNTTVGQPGWGEARKLAGRAFAGATVPIISQDELGSLREAILLNHENVVRVLDGMIAALQGLRDDIERQSKDDLGTRLQHAFKGRLTWWKERNSGDWRTLEFGAPEVPEISFWKRVFVGVRPEKKKEEEE